MLGDQGRWRPRSTRKNSHASPTPTTDGERLYVHFGHMGTAALDLEGKVLWTRTGLYASRSTATAARRSWWTACSSSACDGSDKQSVVALDAKTGQDGLEDAAAAQDRASRSRSARRPSSRSGGKKQIVSPGSDVLAGYDAEDRQGDLADQVQRIFGHPEAGLRPRDGVLFDQLRQPPGSRRSSWAAPAT